MQQVTFEDGAAVSSATKIGARAKLGSIRIHEAAGAWVAADLSMEVADEEGGTYFPICKDEAGAPLYLIPMAASKVVIFDKVAMAIAGVEGWVRFRSVTAATGASDVPQTNGPVTLGLDVKE